ncbi:hypothetical protein [Pseudomonas asplenii]|uniref:hypothetical protein n=1 Tax=Pseudomonas asplenii TaxID=53407 RepID=UPI00036BE705|nr:hypothetical protein [Pseudomonas fuscovaginae]
MRFWLPALGLFCAVSASLQAQAAEDERLTCSAYYMLLSVPGDQPDLTRDQASAASYAFVKQIGDTPETQELLVGKLMELRGTMPGKMTAEGVAKVRAEHDARCRELLKSAWCAAYKGRGPKACVE